MDRDALAMAATSSMGMFQLFLPGLVSISREETPEHKFREAESRAFLFSLALAVGLCAVRGKMIPLLGWAIGVPVMALLYEWSYNNPEITF